MLEFHDKSISEKSEAELAELLNAFDEPIGHRGMRGNPFSAFLGFWKPRSGVDLRVGRLQGGDFIAADKASARPLKAGEKISIVLRQFYLPDLPHENCVAQLSWQASHMFDDGRLVVVTHTTSCDVARGNIAGATGLKIFSNLKVSDAFNLSVSIYVMADEASRPIIGLLQDPYITGGLRLAGGFDPVFAMTTPYVSLAIQALVAASKKNFKVVKWDIGFGLNENSPVRLFRGDYIFMSRTIREGRKNVDIEWSHLKWDNDTDRPKYKNYPLSAPYIIVSITT